MTRMIVTRDIDAPIATVFETVSNVENFKNVIPDIVRVEYTSDVREGVGARFKETRRMGSREATVEMEITEFVPNDRVRLVSDAGGTVWDTVFSVREQGSGTRLEMAMDAKPYRLLAKIFTPLMKGMITKAVGKDMDRVKDHCEKHS